MKPHVFVVMPFGRKEVCAPVAVGDAQGQAALTISFDEVYELLIAPALVQADCVPLRADEEEGAGDIRTDMFFELVTADVVLADISILNANVFYELGVRHGVAARGVFMIQGGWSKRPFDIAPDRTFSYDGKLFVAAAAGRDGAWRARLDSEVGKLAETLRGALDQDEQKIGSPVYKELTGLDPVDPLKIRTAKAKYFGEVFGDGKARVQTAKLNGWAGDILTLASDAPTRFHRSHLLYEAARALISLQRFEAAGSTLKELLEEEPKHVRAQTELGLVLGRSSKTREAKVHMARVAETHAGDPETQGVLGRLYKDLWRLSWDRPELSLADRQQEAALSSESAVSANLHLFGVAQIFNLLNRRLAACRASATRKALG